MRMMKKKKNYPPVAERTCRTRIRFRTFRKCRQSALPLGLKGDPFTLGTLLLTLLASGGVVTTLINTIQSWISRHNQRSITLEINGKKLEIKGPLSKEERQWVENMIGAFQK